MMDSRSPWRLSIIPELLWGIVNFVVLFFQTLIQPSKTRYGDSHTSDYRTPGGPRGPPPPPRRRMGGFRGGPGGPAPPPMGGG
ncbi:selenoprotein K-like isoform X2 [Liolophura sinensis]